MFREYKIVKEKAFEMVAFGDYFKPALWQLNRRSERGTISSQLMLGTVVHHPTYKNYGDDVLVTSPD